MSKQLKRFLIAVDMEGIHGVVGVEYQSILKGLPDYDLAVENATKEINVVAKTLYDNGAELVVVWDNHSKGDNLDFAKLDSRVVKADFSHCKFRMDFAKEHSFDAILFLGYHAREGSFNGILAHSYTSLGIQYIKVNGNFVGEYEIDTWIAGEHGIAPVFAASDDVSLEQLKTVAPKVISVVTKIGKGRNKAELFDEQQVLDDIADGVTLALNGNFSPCKLAGKVEVEVRYTRGERGVFMFEKYKNHPDVMPCFGVDTHTVHFTLSNIKWLPNLL